MRSLFGAIRRDNAAAARDGAVGHCELAHEDVGAPCHNGTWDGISTQMTSGATHTSALARIEPIGSNRVRSRSCHVRPAAARQPHTRGIERALHLHRLRDPDHHRHDMCWDSPSAGYRALQEVTKPYATDCQGSVSGVRPCLGGGNGLTGGWRLRAPQQKAHHRLYYIGGNKNGAVANGAVANAISESVKKKESTTSCRPTDANYIGVGCGVSCGTRTL